MGYNWKKWFKIGEVLYTEEKPSPFEIVGVKRNAISIKFLGRDDEKIAELDSGLLCKLARGRAAVDQREGPLLPAIHRVWGDEGKGEIQNESQYWAIVCERHRRRQLLRGGNIVFREGRRVLYTLSRSERNPRLRRACIERHGAKCTVCKLDFKCVYGPIGEGFIHVHHLTPLADAEAEHDVLVSELVPVCPNCHAMLHQRSPPYTPKELRKMMKAANTED